MNIELQDIAKRYNYQIIFKKIDYTFKSEKKYAILGLNGTGKSTLLKIISGFLSPTQGKIIFKDGNKIISNDEVFNKVNYAAPYINLPQKVTLNELFEFHTCFKILNKNITKKDFFEILNLKNTKNKFIQEYSSGMKQRVKLALTFLFDSHFILLDEPISNLDVQGINWYKQLVTNHLNGRLLIIASNDLKEYNFVDEQINIEDYK